MLRSQRPALRLREALSMVAALTFLPPSGRAEGQAVEAPPEVVAKAPGTSLLELAELVRAQQTLLGEQGRRLEEQGRKIEALEQKLTATGELALSSRNQIEELSQKPAAPTVEAAVAERQEDVEKTLPKIPELQVKDISAEFPRAIKIPGTDAAMRIGGQARLVVIRNFGPVGTDDRFVTSSIPVEGSEEADKGPRTTYAVDPSRLNFDVRTPSGVGYVRAFVEADFAGTGRTFRLRHAYGQWKSLVIGQTWSTFSDPEAEPDGIDFEGLNAISLFRQPQIRWSHGLGEQFALALSAENPNPSITGAAGVNQVPDLVARVRWEPRRRIGLGFLRGGSHVQGALLLRQIRGAAADRPNDPVGTQGFGFNLSGRLAVPFSTDRRDYVTFAFNGGSGIGRYITDLGTLGGQDAVYDPATNSLEALPVGSGYIGYQHWWSETVRTTATYGGVFVDNLDIQTPDSLRQTQRTSLNLSWSPIGRIDLVSEFLWGRRLDKDGRKGSATQLQLGGVIRF